MQGIPNTPATLVALLTPPGRGAVAVIVVVGDAATPAVAECFHTSGKALDERRENEIAYGRWGAVDGEEIVAIRRSASRVEVHCHGGAAAAARILADLAARNCTIVDQRDWSAADAASAIVAEADLALADARTERAARILLEQREGALAGKIAQSRDLISAKEHEAALDALTRLIAQSAVGLRLVDPWRVVLGGAPNVGKSSLINALLGFERAIVFDRPGTTRDVVAALTAFDGWPVELADTAGLGESTDALEQIAAERAKDQLARADLILAVCDASRPWQDAQSPIAASAKTLLVHSKSDLHEGNRNDRPRGVWTSVKTNEGIDELAKQIARRLVPEPPAPGEAVPFTPRQCELIHSAKSALEIADAATALRKLDEVASR